MKQSQIINYYLELTDKAISLELRLLPVCGKFQISYYSTGKILCIADDLNVVAGYLEAYEYLSK